MNTNSGKYTVLNFHTTLNTLWKNMLQLKRHQVAMKFGKNVIMQMTQMRHSINLITINEYEDR